jgi:DNA polymerase-3 subunit gamma/tau
VAAPEPAPVQVAAPEPAPRPEPEPQPEPEPAPEPAREPEPDDPGRVAPLGPVGAADVAGADDLERLRRGWTSVVTTITERNRAVKPLITACRPIGVEGNVVTLGFPEEQGFLKDVADRRRPLLEECIGVYLGHDVGVRCIATNLDLVPPLPDDEEAERLLAEAHRIFADERLDAPEVT